RLTEQADFYKTNDETVQVPMMTLHEELEFRQDDTFQMVRLPYGEEEYRSMYLFLPHEDQDLKAIQDILSEVGLQDIRADLEEKEGTVKLPKFTLEEEMNLNDILESLGIHKAFDPKEADFSNILKSEEN